MGGGPLGSIGAVASWTWEGWRASPSLPASTPGGVAENAERVRAAASRAGRQVAILQDLPGPKLRIGSLDDDIAELKPGETLVLACGSEDSGPSSGSRSAGPSSDAVDPGDVIYLADGANAPA